jgi:hypothetical protein
MSTATDYSTRTRMESLISVEDNYRFRNAATNIHYELTEDGFGEEEIMNFLQSLIYSSK